MKHCLIISFAVSLLPTGNVARSEDWPMYGRHATRNAVSPRGNPPSDWSVGTFDRKSGEWQREKSRNIKWMASLGNSTYGDPVVAGGLVWVGTNNYRADPKYDASVLACFRESDGQPLYRYVSPRLPHGHEHDWPTASLSCSPLIEGDRLWFTTNRCETVCLDIGPLTRGQGEPLVIWKVDMLKSLGVQPKGSPMTYSHFCSPGSYESWLYVITGHGTDATNSRVEKPQAPSLVCFEKESGKIVWSDNSPGENILYGQWASPLAAEIGGVGQVVAPLGDGWVRSFEAASGKLLWEFDMNAKTAAWHYGGKPDRNLILATPVLADGRIYIASGQPPILGEGPGRLCCLDPTKRGDISSKLVVDKSGNNVPHRRVQAVDVSQGEKVIPNPNSGLVWEFKKQGDKFEDELHGTVSNVVIHDSLLILPDLSGVVHCFDALTGKRHWSYDMLADVMSSPLIVGKRVYITNGDGDVMVFPLSADPKVALRNKAADNADENNMQENVDCSPIFANGTLYVAARSRLFAIAQSDPSPADKTGGDWPQWRGRNRDNVSPDEDLLQAWPAGGPPLKWRTDGIGQGIASVAIAGGSIYTLGSAGDQEHVIALHEATGELRWRSPIGPAINDAPLMRWLSQRTPTIDGERLYVSTAKGDLICLQSADGQELWRTNYPTDFGSKGRSWGFVDRPLVDGDKLICTPGGTAASFAALNKGTGEVVWKCLLEPAELGSYSATVMVETDGLRQYVAIFSNSLVSVRATDGKLLWRHASNGLGWINSVTPIVADPFIILPGGRDAAEMVVLKLARNGDNVSADAISRTKLNLDHFQDATVRLEDHLYTAVYGGMPLCVNWRTGETRWGPQRTEGKGKVALTYADRRLYVLHADGTLLLAEATPVAYCQHGKFVLPDHIPGVGATFPIVTRGWMYVRDNDHLFCYDVGVNADGKSAAPRVVKLELAHPGPPTVSTDRPRGKNKEPDAIFVPTPHDVVAKMLEVADVKKTDVVVDLGSGDGRIVIAAARSFGSKAVGIELDEELVRQSRENVRKAEVGELVRIEQADILAQDLSAADVVALYLPPKLMDRLLPQLGKLKPGARVVSHYFKFTGIPPVKSLKMDSRDDGDTHEIHLWTAPLGEPAP